MIRQRTVLVLGAGASASYGFPSGRELRDQIVRGLRRDIDQPFQLLTARASCSPRRRWSASSGFGYLKGNVERLGITSLSSNIGLTGRAYGLMEGERAAVTQLLGHRVSLGNPSHGVLEFFRTHGLLA